MSETETAAGRQVNWPFGAAALAFGAFVMLAGAGVVPERVLGKAHAPGWVVVACGLAFFIAGAAILLQSAGGADANGRLAPTAPRWMAAAQYLLVLTILVVFAAIGSWVAFGPGERPISVNLGGLPLGRAPEYFGRAVFGLGAALLWLCVAVMTASGLRRLRNRG